MEEPLDQVLRSLRSKSLLEELASIEHERWSEWQAYLHAQCNPGIDGSLTIPAELVQRWSRQMITPYSQLTEAEKKSDRNQVLRYLPVILDAVENAD